MMGVILMAAAKLRSHKLQTGVLLGGCFFLSFLGLSVLLLRFALIPSFDISYKKLNAPDFCVSIAQTDMMMDEEALEQFVCGLSYINQYEISKRYLANNVQLLNQTIDFAYLAASDSKSPDSGQVMINNAVCGTEAGDVIWVHLNGQTAQFRVADVFTDPLNSAPDNNIPYFYVSEQALEELSEGFCKGSVCIELWSAIGDGQEQRFLADFEKHFGTPFLGEVYTMDDIRHSFIFRYDILKEFAVFFFLFLFTVILLLTVLLTQMEVYGDKDIIAKLKAIGFTDGKICLIYMLRSLLLAVLGGTVGLGVSAVVMKRWFGSMFASIGTNVFSFWHLHFWCIFTMTIMCIVIAASVWIPTMRILRALREDMIKVNALSHRKNGFIRFQKPCFLCFAMGFYRCMGKRTETILIFLLSMGIGALGLTGFYLIDGVRQADVHLTDWGIAKMDIYVARKANMDERESGLLDRLNEDEAVDYYYAALSDYLVLQIGEHGPRKRVFGEIYNQTIPSGLSFSFLDGRNPENDGEAAVGINFAQKNQVGIGDTLILFHAGEERQLSIVGIYPSYKAYADSVRIITPDILRFFQNQAEGYYSIVLREGENVNQYAMELAQDFEDFNFFPMQRSTTRFVKNLLYPLSFVMCLLLFVYFFLLLLLKRWMCLECRDEFALLYQIGMTMQRIRAIVRWRFAIPILAGAVIAVFPLSLYVFPLLLRPLANRLGLFELPIYPNVLMVATAFLVMLFVGMLALCRLDGKVFRE